MPRFGDGADQVEDSPVPLTTEEIAKRLLDSPVPLTRKEIARTLESGRKSRRKSWQHKKVLFDWDTESSVFVAPLRSAVGRRRTWTTVACTHDQKDIVESILAGLQQCVADPAYAWLAQESSRGNTPPAQGGIQILGVRTGACHPLVLLLGAGCCHF